MPRTHSRYPRQTHADAYARRPRAPQAQQTAQRDRQKRYGMVFDTNPLQGMVRAGAGDNNDEVDDDESTWSMSRARTSRAMRRPRRPHANANPNARGRNSSPAQEIAARYRASHSPTTAADEPFGASTTTFSVSYADGYSSAATLGTGNHRSRKTSDSTLISQASGPKVRFRDSWNGMMDRAVRPYRQLGSLFSLVLQLVLVLELTGASPYVRRNKKRS